MDDAAKESPVSPVTPPTGGLPESPTTARPLDFEDEEATHPTTAPPAKPPRPMNPRDQAELTLREAFPAIDAAVVRAVLTASRGEVEPAFNALLGMSDPDSQREPEPPAKPPRPTRQQPTTTARSQLEADEVYARQLAEHYSGAGGRQTQPRQPSRYNEQLQGSRVGRPGASPNPDDVPWRSFIDDDLPEIRDNIKKGFLETQTTVNKWLGNLKKKIDGEEDEPDFTSQPPRPAQGYTTRGGYGRRSGDLDRRSSDMQRYDADPQVIGDDFSKMDLRDGDPLPDRRSSRPLANPNLFKPTPGTDSRQTPAVARKVSFHDGPPEEIADMYSSSTKPLPIRPTSAGKTSKWQPLSTVDPSPVADNDPFSLGDSDDEKDAKPITLKDDDDEDERLQKATAEAMKDSMKADAK